MVKPSWRPPKKAFGPVWTTLYASMGYASYLVWNASGGFTGPGLKALEFYGMSILLNWSWTPLFFGAHELGAVRMALTGGAGRAWGIEFFQKVCDKHRAGFDSSRN